MRHLVVHGARVGPVGPVLEQLKTRRASRRATSAPPTTTSAWLVALVTIAVMVRNVVLSGLIAFAAGFLTSRGNVFDGMPSSAQSRVEFLTASMLWTQLLAFVAMLVIHTTRLAHATHAAPPRRSIAYWFVRMLQAVLFAYALASSALVAFVWLCHRFVPARLDDLQIEYYIGTFTNQVFFALCDARVRYLYRSNTAQGRRRSTDGRLNSPTKRSAFGYCARAYAASIPTQAVNVFASVYVHVVSRLTFSSPRMLNVFLAGSLVFKLLTQEGIKHLLLSHDTRNLRKMCILVSVPTVIIDTQVRVVILSISSLQSSLTTSIILAAAEIIMRGAKVLLLRVAIRRRQRRVADTTQAAAFSAWQLQQVQYHTAETIADMYAEYVAIVCSAAIAALWSGNPQYVRGIQRSQSASLWATLAWQTGLEIGVDYVSSVLEMAAGATLDTRGRNYTRGYDFGTFLGYVFLMLVIVNMNISAMLYIRPR